MPRPARVVEPDVTTIADRALPPGLSTARAVLPAQSQQRLVVTSACKCVTSSFADSRPPSTPGTQRPRSPVPMMPLPVKLRAVVPVVPAALTPSTGPLVLPAGRPMAVFPVACSGQHMTFSTWSADWCQVWNAGRLAQSNCPAAGQGCMPNPQLTRMALALTPALAAWKACGRKAHNQIVRGHLPEAVTQHAGNTYPATREGMLWHIHAYTCAHQQRIPCCLACTHDWSLSARVHQHPR